MKNWLPLVFGPALAMARMPGLSKRADALELVLEAVARVAAPGARGDRRPGS